jgi:hypothetical protein
VKIKYPVFNNQSVLNGTLENKITNLFELDVAPPKDLNHLASSFFSIFRQSPTVYRLDIKSYIIRQDSSFSALQISGYAFAGGDHGSSLISFINWNTKSKKNIELDDILVNGYRDKLTKIADTIFRNQEKLSYAASLANDYFFKDNKFALNNNFSITPLGIRFLYNETEIKPYAAGQTNLFIPYSKIKSLLRPNTVITQYIK